MDMLKLTLDQDGQSVPAYVAIDHIVCVGPGQPRPRKAFHAPSSAGSVVQLVGGRMLEVLEEPDQIIATLTRDRPATFAPATVLYVEQPF